MLASDRRLVSQLFMETLSSSPHAVLLVVLNLAPSFHSIWCLKDQAPVDSMIEGVFFLGFPSSFP